MFVKNETDRWTPVGGTYDAWPQHLSELKTEVPYCGCGHFLVADLEIDQWCVELAAFALAMRARADPNAGVLLDKSNIKRQKDRDQDVSRSSWYRLDPDCGGKERDQIIDHHLKSDEKKKTRGGGDAK